jgi:hypothetical protein
MLQGPHWSALDRTALGLSSTLYSRLTPHASIPYLAENLAHETIGSYAYALCSMLSALERSDQS